MQSFKKILKRIPRTKKASFFGSNYDKNNPFWGKGSLFLKIGLRHYFQAK